MRRLTSFAIRCLARIAPESIKKVVRPSGSYLFDAGTTINDIRRLTLDYVKNMAVYENGKLMGYRHSSSTEKPVLYATLASLLLKHLYNQQDDAVEQEIGLVLEAQSDDGFFRDPVISCPEAEKYDWFGWKHLTLHALMTLALYEKSSKYKLRYLPHGAGSLTCYLKSLDWGKEAADTSNTVQNIGVMLQYARDYHDDEKAGLLLKELYRFTDAIQDPKTGLYGDSFNTPYELSLGCQAGYHLWLLYFYDKQPVQYVEKIVDNLLKTQNILGGYGVRWNSSACEDIDTIDPLLRFSRLTDYRSSDIQTSLKRALPAVLNNLNGDGGWVFQRHREWSLIHPQMYSGLNESSLFYSWFRTLGLAYLLTALPDVPTNLKYQWNFKRAPGHQFL